MATSVPGTAEPARAAKNEASPTPQEPLQDRPCRNCGTPVSDLFCSHCGQSAREHRRPLVGLLRDFFTTVFDLDARFLSSLRTLVSRPGRLTQRFLAGQQASMLPPVRMYLVFSLLLFLFVDIPVPEARKFNVYVGGQLVGREVEDPSLGQLEIGTTPQGRSLPWIAPLLEAKENSLRQMDPQLLLERVFSGLEGNLSKALIFFIPLLALVLKILYLDHKHFYYDHVIFALHVQSALFLSIIVAWCLSWIDTRFFLLLLVSPVYLGQAMRRMYGQSWLRTCLKLALLLTSYFFVLGLVLSATFVAIIFRI